MKRPGHHHWTRSWGAALATAATASGAFATDGVDLAPIAAALADSARRTEILVIGDSINNPGKTDNLQTGFIRQWRPGHWRSWQPPIAGNGVARFSHLSAGAVADLAVLVPGNHQDAPAGAPLGGITSTVRWLHPFPGGPTFARLYESGIHPAAWQVGGFRDRDELQRFGLAGTVDLHFEYLALPDRAGSAWELAAGSTSQSSLGTPEVRFERADDWGLLESTVSIEPSPGPVLFPLRGAWFHPDAQYPDDVHLFARGIRFEDGSHPGGLGISYVGYGGWAFENHAYPLGDSRNSQRMRVDGDGNATDPFEAGYSDEALRQVVSVRRPNLYMVMLGANNASDADMSMLAEAEDLIARIRQVHDAASKEAPELDDSPRILLVSMFDLISDTPMSEVDPDWLRTLADHLASIAVAEDDVSFVDLHQMVRTELGAWEDWNETFLSDGVHPNEAGADRFASMIWDAISASRCTADFDGDGFVGGKDLGRWLTEFGPTELPSIADIDGDGLVDGRDLGQVLLQWGTCEP